jgi:hypothetical protein
LEIDLRELRIDAIAESGRDSSTENCVMILMRMKSFEVLLISYPLDRMLMVT